jgi:hypothetical protein
MPILRKFFADAPQTTENKATRATLELMYSISRELASALDLRTVLQRVLFLAMKNAGATSGSILVLDSSGQPVESALIAGGQVHIRPRSSRITFGHGVAGWVIPQRAALVADTSR